MELHESTGITNYVLIGVWRAFRDFIEGSEENRWRASYSKFRGSERAESDYEDHRASSSAKILGLFAVARAIRATAGSSVQTDRKVSSTVFWSWSSKLYALRLRALWMA